MGRGQAGSADRNDDGDAPGPEARSEETLEGSGRQAGRDARAPATDSRGNVDTCSCKHSVVRWNDSSC